MKVTECTFSVVESSRESQLVESPSHFVEFENLSPNSVSWALPGDLFSPRRPCLQDWSWGIMSFLQQKMKLMLGNLAWVWKILFKCNILEILNLRVTQKISSETIQSKLNMLHKIAKKASHGNRKMVYLDSKSNSLKMSVLCLRSRR